MSLSRVEYKRIATEEAWSPPEMMQMYRDALARRSVDDVGFNSMWGFYLGSKSERATQIIEKLQSLDERRLRDMQATGIDTQLLLLTSPGVQVFDAATATALARSSNDQLAAAIRKHPRAFAGLAAVAPQDPAGAANEIERAMRTLGLKGVVLNSHVHGEYLDHVKYWDIFAAAEACDAPIYIHPGTAPDSMIQPFLEAGLDGAIYGFGVETGLHILRLIVSGLFDRFPKLRIVIGHMGEALPFWLFRLDYMYRATLNSKRYPHWKPNQKLPSDYLRENLYITTSGMAWEPAILFSQQVLGVDRVLYAMDYPYQFVESEVAVHDNLPISAADKQKLFQRNAERVFKLELDARP
ncbi:MAG TPA: amidohydrolase family protein [Steroidobacteraceae bacterium]|nr:amidohydrolase family protein [Steroidobacteraceae bacterium]